MIAANGRNYGSLFPELVETAPLSFQIDLAGSCAVKRVNRVGCNLMELWSLVI